jgi:hypothetical protein
VNDPWFLDLMFSPWELGLVRSERCFHLAASHWELIWEFQCGENKSYKKLTKK